MRELPIPRIVLNPWQFLTRSILTPAHRLAVCVDEYAVRPSLLHERFLVATISLDQFCARISLVFRLRAPPVTVHTPTRIRSRRWMSLEEALEIAPCPFGELLRRVFRVSRHGDNRICLSTIPAHNNIERQSSSPHVFGQGIRVREADASLTDVWVWQPISRQPRARTLRRSCIRCCPDRLSPAGEDGVTSRLRFRSPECRNHALPDAPPALRDGAPFTAHPVS